MKQVALVLAALLVLFASGRATAEALDAEEIELKVLIDERRDEMVRTLAAWVDVNTGSWNGPGLDAFARVLSEPLRELDFEVEILPGDAIDLPGRGRVATGPVIRARRAAAEHVERPLRLLLVGHFDTVFESDSRFQRFEIDASKLQRATGPGIADMKGGTPLALLCRGVAPMTFIRYYAIKSMDGHVKFSSVRLCL